MLGIPLSVKEIVTERRPPLRKVWGTTGRPQLLVIGPYRMGYEITPKAQSLKLRVFIDYALPDGHVSYWLGRLFGSFYARWCTQRMADDAAAHFQKVKMDDPGSTPRKVRRRISSLVFTDMRHLVDWARVVFRAAATRASSGGSALHR